MATPRGGPCSERSVAHRTAMLNCRPRSRHVKQLSVRAQLVRGQRWLEISLAVQRIGAVMISSEAWLKMADRSMRAEQERPHAARMNSYTRNRPTTVLPAPMSDARDR